jgi:hypothetical protein
MAAWPQESGFGSLRGSRLQIFERLQPPSLTYVTFATEFPHAGEKMLRPLAVLKDLRNSQVGFPMRRGMEYSVTRQPAPNAPEAAENVEEKKTIAGRFLTPPREITG